MPKITVNAGTTLQDLQAFAQQVRDGHQIRGKQNDDGSITLYSKNPDKFTFGFKANKRAEKYQNAKDAIDLVLRNTAGNQGGLQNILDGVFNQRIPQGNVATSGATLKSLVTDSVTALKTHVKDAIRDAAQTGNIDTFFGDPKLTEVLTRYAKSRMGEENVNFLVAVRAYDQNPTSHGARDIWNEFCDTNAAQRINVYRDGGGVEEVFDDIAGNLRAGNLHGLFDEATKDASRNVLALMQPPQNFLSWVDNNL